MFRAYFDASGNKRTSVLTIVDFISRANKWDRFNVEWMSILSRYEVSAMHMTDFASSKREFSSWKGQTDRRREFIEALSGCIRKHTNKGFGSSLLIPAYEDVNKKFLLSERAGSPFSMCMRACLGGVAKWAQGKNLKTEQLLIAIEDGDEDQSKLIRSVKRDGFNVISMQSPTRSHFKPQM